MKTFSVRVSEAKCAAKGNSVHCVEGKHVQFSPAGLGHYFYRDDWDPVLYDLLLVAGAVEFCDHAFPRSTVTWARSLKLSIPVHDPDRWKDRIVFESLQDLLQFLTGDAWEIIFRKRRAANSARRQGSLNFFQEYSGVLPFSDGLDSLCVASLLDESEKLPLARVRMGSIVGAKDKRHYGVAPFAILPYKVNLYGISHKESSARHRGFKFAALCAVAAQFAECSDIYVTESGQGVLGPSLVTTGVSHPDYRAHPRFLRKMEVFLNQLLGSSLNFKTPRIWYTKGETLKAFLALPTSNEELLWATRSCWRQARQIGYSGCFPQCGVCAACMLRRMSMHYAGAPDKLGAFVWDDLSARDFDAACIEGCLAPCRKQKSSREYAVAGVLHMDHLTNLVPNNNDETTNFDREIYHLSGAMKIEQEEVRVKAIRMLNQHRTEWEAFLASLGKHSFVHEIAIR